MLIHDEVHLRSLRHSEMQSSCVKPHNVSVLQERPWKHLQTRHNSPQLGLWTRLIPHWINSSTTCYRTACSHGLTTFINVSVYSALCHFTFTRKKNRFIFVHLDFNRMLQRCCGGVLLCYVKPHWMFIFHFLSLNYSSDVIFLGQIQLWGCSQQLKSPVAYSGFKYCTVLTIYRQLSEPFKLTFHKQLKATELFYNRNRIKLLRRTVGYLRCMILDPPADYSVPVSPSRAAPPPLSAAAWVANPHPRSSSGPPRTLSLSVPDSWRRARQDTHTPIIVEKTPTTPAMVTKMVQSNF